MSAKELNIGDYVRTKNKTFQPSQIAKITNMKKDEGYKNQYFIILDHNLPTAYNFHIYSEDVIKSSPNIRDLIEDGDYVNGCKVVIINNIKHLETRKGLVFLGILEQIKSIVTKEQFESMKYNIGE